MNLPDIHINLPTPPVEVDAKEAFRMGVDLLLGRTTPRDIIREKATANLYRAADILGGDTPEERARMLRSATEEGRAELEDWLRTAKYGLISWSGEPGSGKTTGAADLLWRFFRRRHTYAIGIPAEVLPKGWQEISAGELSLIGSKLEKAAKAQERVLQAYEDGEFGRTERDRKLALLDPKHIMADWLPAGSAVLIDDAGGYLSSGASDRPINRAIRNIIDIRRHLDLIVCLTFQSFSGVDIKVSQAADAFFLKPSNRAISGGDRPEILRMLKRANEYFEDYADRKEREGLTRQEVRESEVLLCWAECPAVRFSGPWRHQRPSWYGERFSQNARTVDLEETEYRVLDDEEEAD